MLYVFLCIASLTFWASAGLVRDAERHRVVVVGAGVAGFTAAATLLEHNVTDILVLEASNRIGGRIHTVQFGGVSLDKGAEFIHGQKNNSVYELLEPFDLLTSYTPLLAPENILFVNMSGGHVANSTYIRSIVDEAYEIMSSDDVRYFKGSIGDYFFPRLNDFIKSKGIEPQLGEALHHIVPLIELSESAANNLSQLGAWGVVDCLTNEGDHELKWKPGTGGYKTLFDILLKKFPDPSEELPVMNKTKLNKAVTQIKRRESDVQVTCADGSTYLADHVIVTVSLGVLKRHAVTMFQPALPAEKTAAIENLGFGCLGKVFILFPNRWWPNGTNLLSPLYSNQALQDFRMNSKHGNWTSYITGFFPVINHDRMLCVWLSGNQCWNLDNLSEEQVIEGLMELLKKMFADKYEIPQPEGILKSEWGSYPYTLGSYSYRSVESDSLNITNRNLAEPLLEGGKPVSELGDKTWCVDLVGPAITIGSFSIRVVLFAGEATNHDYHSLVHGALDTGRREAQNIINHLKGRS